MNTRLLPTSSRLLHPRARQGRRLWTNPIDPQPSKSFGDSIQEKDPTSIRFFFQNVKGLTHSTGMEDYKYYLQCMISLHADIVGLSETNTSWQQSHLQADFRNQVRKYYRQSKVVFGYPKETIDKCTDGSTYQPGGNITMVTGSMTASSFGQEEGDSTGLGRWSSVTFRGKKEFKLTAITAYRTCGGNIRTAPLGSTYSREHNFFRDQGHQSPNPRRMFLQHLEAHIRSLQRKGHKIMLDANSDLKDIHFGTMIAACDLHNLHQHNPPPSTYIGADNRRIDYMFGCQHIKDAASRSGTLSYTEGPQSDHRGLYVDLNLCELQSFVNPIPLTTTKNRYLYTANPELVGAYLDHVKKYFEDHNMESRIQE